MARDYESERRIVEEQQDTIDLYERAEARVDDDPRLASWRDFILADWPEGDEHWQWVIDADAQEIIDWAEKNQS